MRILFLTSLYSTPLLPNRGLPNARIARAMKRYADVRVVAPVPYYPARFVGGRPDLLALAEAPTVEKDEDGDDVLHPRYAHLPRIGRASYPWLYAGSVLGGVAAEVRSFAPDVVLSAWAFPDGVAAVALARHFGLPSVLRVMGSDVNAYALEPWRKPQIRWALSRATRVIAVSSALRDVCLDLLESPSSASHVDVVPTGVDPASFHPIDRAHARAVLGVDPDAQLVIVPARLSPEKGIADFLDAFVVLGGRSIAWILGEGPLERALRAKVDALGLRDRVTFVGQIPERRMSLHYAAADLVCLPSTEEGWPNVLLESFACGCPWVATQVGGVPEIARIADGAVLARPSDPLDLSRALGVALARTFDREAIAARGREVSLDATVRSYLETAERAVASARRSRRIARPPAAMVHPLLG